MELVQKIVVRGVVVNQELTETKGIFATIMSMFSENETVLPIFNVIGDSLNGLQGIGINDAIFATVDNKMVFEDQHECEDDLQEALENIKKALDLSDHTVVIYLENPGEKLQHVIEVKITQHGESADVEVVVASAVQNPINFAPRDQYAMLLKEKVNENYLDEAKAEFNNFCTSISQVLQASLSTEVINEPVKQVAVIQANYSVKQFAQSTPRNIRSKKSYPQHFGSSFHGYGYTNPNYMYYYHDSGLDFFDYYMLSLIFADNEVVYIDQHGNEVPESELPVLEEIQEGVNQFDNDISDIIEHEEQVAQQEAAERAEQEQLAQQEESEADELLAAEEVQSQNELVEESSDLNFGLNEDSTRAETVTSSDCAPADCDCACDCACDCSSD